MSSTPETNKAANLAVDDFPQSKQQPLWHVVVLNIMTMSGYTIIWFWKTWKDLADFANTASKSETDASSQGDRQIRTVDPALHKFEGVSPILMTMGALVPGLQLFLTSLLFARVAAIYPNKQSIVSQKPIGTGIAMTLVMFAFFWLYKLPGPFMFLFLLYVIPFVIAQSWINAFWKTQEQPDMLVRQAFSAGELASLILGAVLLGLIVTGFAIGH